MTRWLAEPIGVGRWRVKRWVPFANGWVFDELAFVAEARHEPCTLELSISSPI
jgi:hypothetical protein